MQSVSIATDVVSWNLDQGEVYNIMSDISGSDGIVIDTSRYDML
jgi:hypothetical protein